MWRPQTVGELRASGYPLKSVKEEMRQNLIRLLGEGQTPFPDILGFDETVLPQIYNAVLSRHDLLLLGLRGQAKTRILRRLVGLLDEVIPVVEGSEINDHPYAPVSRYARDRIAALGDETPIAWVGRDQRYHEKLATPDVTIADLVGEVDLVKHAEGRYLASELTMHFGLIPRSNRGIFCINELPDLSPRIQVGLFNILEERDVQIRGFPVRLPLDLCLAFSANPEDYTSRGRIVSPLKDRIGSVVRTHYPITRSLGIAVTEANAWTVRGPLEVRVPRYLSEVVEEVARLARVSPEIDQLSGVSTRFTISGYENLISNAERRALLVGETVAVPRPCDLVALHASGRGKIEPALGEGDGLSDELIARLTAQALRDCCESWFPGDVLEPITAWFAVGHRFTTGEQVSSSEYVTVLRQHPRLADATHGLLRRLDDGWGGPFDDALTASTFEFLLEGLYQRGRLARTRQGPSAVFALA